MYRVRVEDVSGDRWSFNVDTVEAALDIAREQRVRIVWIKERDDAPRAR